MLRFGAINGLSTGGVLGVTIDVSADKPIGDTPGVGIDELASRDVSIWVAIMAALDPTPELPSPKEILLCGWEACSC